MRKCLLSLILCGMSLLFGFLPVKGTNPFVTLCEDGNFNLTKGTCSASTTEGNLSDVSLEMKPFNAPLAIQVRNIINSAYSIVDAVLLQPQPSKGLDNFTTFLTRLKNLAYNPQSYTFAALILLTVLGNIVFWVLCIIQCFKQKKKLRFQSNDQAESENMSDEEIYEEAYDEKPSSPSLLSIFCSNKCLTVFILFFGALSLMTLILAVYFYNVSFSHTASADNIVCAARVATNNFLLGTKSITCNNNHAEAFVGLGNAAITSQVNSIKNSIISYITEMEQNATTISVDTRALDIQPLFDFLELNPMFATDLYICSDMSNSVRVEYLIANTQAKASVNQNLADLKVAVDKIDTMRDEIIAAKTDINDRVNNVERSLIDKQFSSSLQSIENIFDSYESFNVSKYESYIYSGSSTAFFIGSVFAILAVVYAIVLPKVQSRRYGTFAVLFSCNCQFLCFILLIAILVTLAFLVFSSLGAGLYGGIHPVISNLNNVIENNLDQNSPTYLKECLQGKSTNVAFNIDTSAFDSHLKTLNDFKIKISTFLNNLDADLLFTLRYMNRQNEITESFGRSINVVSLTKVSNENNKDLRAFYAYTGSYIPFEYDGIIPMRSSSVTQQELCDDQSLTDKMLIAHLYSLLSVSESQFNCLKGQSCDLSQFTSQYTTLRTKAQSDLEPLLKSLDNIIATIGEFQKYVSGYSLECATIKKSIEQVSANLGYYFSTQWKLFVIACVYMASLCCISLICFWITTNSYKVFTGSRRDSNTSGITSQSSSQISNDNNDAQVSKKVAVL